MFFFCQIDPDSIAIFYLLPILEILAAAEATSQVCGAATSSRKAMIFDSKFMDVAMMLPDSYCMLVYEVVLITVYNITLCCVMLLTCLVLYSSDS